MTFDAIDDATRMRWESEVTPRGALKLLTPILAPVARRQSRTIWQSLKRALESRDQGAALRCIGARVRDVRRIFGTEGIALALAGWPLGVGYALDRGLVWLIKEVVDVEVPVAFRPSTS